MISPGIITCIPVMTAWSPTWYVTTKRHPSNSMKTISFFPSVFIFLAVSLVSITPLAASGSEESPVFTVIPQINSVPLEGRKLNIVATTSFIGDVLTDIAGNHAEITILMPPGQNPHSWDPGPANIAAIEDADLIFVNGFGLEEELLRILKGMKIGPVIPVSAGIEPLGNDGEDNHKHEKGDPHVWLSPLNVLTWAENIGAVLSSADPANRESYEKAASSYMRELGSLNAEIHNMVAILKPADRRLVVDHVSFEYYAREYDFTILGYLVSSPNDQAEPSAREIAALSDLVRKENIEVLFVGGTAGRVMRNLADSVAAESGRDLPVVELLSGSLAPSGQRGDKYPDFIRFNTELIIEALAGG
jgi:ABC-type Zn uptake system ZnuABC Zn-binding protein ZnuA